MVFRIPRVDRFHQGFWDLIPHSSGVYVRDRDVESVADRVIALIDAVAQQIAGLGLSVIRPGVSELIRAVDDVELRTAVVDVFKSVCELFGCRILLLFRCAVCRFVSARVTS